MELTDAQLDALSEIGLEGWALGSYGHVDMPTGFVELHEIDNETRQAFDDKELPPDGWYILRVNSDGNKRVERYETYAAALSEWNTLCRQLNHEYDKGNE